MAYADQERDAIDPNKAVWEAICDGQETITLGGKQINSRAYVSWFNFTGGDQQKKAGILSGGERNRLHIARIVKSEANVLLLDEPTNDLDVNTLRALEDALGTQIGLSRFPVFRFPFFYYRGRGQRETQWKGMLYDTVDIK